MIWETLRGHYVTLGQGPGIDQAAWKEGLQQGRSEAKGALKAKEMSST